MDLTQDEEEAMRSWGIRNPGLGGGKGQGRAFLPREGMVMGSGGAAGVCLSGDGETS